VLLSGVCHEVDVRTVLVRKCFGLGQIGAGLAWWYRKYARERSAQDRATYAAVEQDPPHQTSPQ
jgi:hypothetical protein